jgi:phospholipase C
VGACSACLLGAFLSIAVGVPSSKASATPSPIQHVVVIYQENHSFDNVLGAFCVKNSRCDGTTTGKLPGGTPIPLKAASDFVPNVDHSTAAQATAIDGGKMDGFALNTGCTKSKGYHCYQQFQPKQIPNLTALATKFAVSDRTFSQSPVPSFGAHIELVASTLDGFTGDNPTNSKFTKKKGPGWGCDSFKDTVWVDQTGHAQTVPACVPAPNGTGPYRPSPVSWTPTIMDRLDGAGLSWKIYANQPSAPDHFAYNWSICPTFADCRYTAQFKNFVDSSTILSDASSGALPRFSVLLPSGPNGPTSQHNGTSMAQGDNWIGQVVNAIETGPAWRSTAIFIAYDDCGCFYDHVPPPHAGMGIRVPMVIVSPYARPSFTDSNVASFSSILAFTEHNFGLSALGPSDASAYDFSGSFNYSQTPLSGVKTTTSAIPKAELTQLRHYRPDPNDPS